MIIYIKLSAKSKLNPREFPINFEFYINPPYPKEQPIVLCKSHFCFPSLFDNRNFSNALINKWSSFNHIDLLITMIHNIPYLITKYENDIENGLFYYDGEYSYSFLYNVNDFVLNSNNYIYKVYINNLTQNEEENMAYLIITDIHFIFLRPETPQKNRARILYLGNIVDFDSFIQQQINSTEEESNDVLVQIKYKENIKAKFTYYLKFNKNTFEFISMILNQRKTKFEKIFKLYYPFNNFDSSDISHIDKLKQIINIREQSIKEKHNEFYAVKDLIELYQKMIEIYSMNDDETYKDYVSKFQSIVQQSSVNK